MLSITKMFVLFTKSLQIAAFCTDKDIHYDCRFSSDDYYVHPDTKTMTYGEIGMASNNTETIILSKIGKKYTKIIIGEKDDITLYNSAKELVASISPDFFSNRVSFSIETQITSVRELTDTMRKNDRVHEIVPYILFRNGNITAVYTGTNAYVADNCNINYVNVTGHISHSNEVGRTISFNSFGYVKKLVFKNGDKFSVIEKSNMAKITADAKDTTQDLLEKLRNSVLPDGKEIVTEKIFNTIEEVVDYLCSYFRDNSRQMNIADRKFTNPEQFIDYVRVYLSFDV